ncbi:hypothetical protein C2845_PM01G35470 [Panicum miliaceum]|uniref:Uncharacterized protein n=1 Tax=Panicum miliaceum TaxID=4540 RepID=A0A3L6TL00_PANMI|nr:hypothetical protein C2845_PM01G35470 [Panicum miliaceum]
MPVAARSLEALVAFLTCYFRYLRVDLWGAIEMARWEGHAERSTVTVGQESACKTAATAAMHPDPDAAVNFLVSTFPGLPVSLQTEPMALDVQLISQMLMEHCSIPHGAAQTVPELSEEGSKLLSWIQSDFKEESFVFAKVNAALKKYTQHTGERRQILRLGSPLRSRAYASKKNSELSHQLNAKGRCFYCENEGAKIVHPDSEKYNAFERKACGDLGGLTVDDSGYWLITGSVDICEEDCISFDADRDAKCAEFLNARARTVKGPMLV